LKLQKRFSRRVGEKEYSKWIVILPDAIVAELNWKEGIQLESNINPKNKSLILKPAKDN
jgi:bifunctional DNA-binding transcriptional regulator/antitoxin component of YhaV-PrlF toxin-antitoxin module